MRYSPHFTDGKAESREPHPQTSSYYRAEIRFKPRPSWFWNVSSNLPPGTASYGSPYVMLPLLPNLSGPYLFKCLSSLHPQYWHSVNICWAHEWTDFIFRLPTRLCPHHAAFWSNPGEGWKVLLWRPSQPQCVGQVQQKWWTSQGYSKMCQSSTTRSEEWRFSPLSALLMWFLIYCTFPFNCL